MKSKKNYFEGKNILITGANQGLGLSVALSFAALKSNLILCGRNKIKNNRALNVLKKISNKEIIFENLDISNNKKFDYFFKKVEKKFKKIDILISNAGIYGPKGFSENLPWKDWRKTIDINLMGNIYVINKLLKHFKKFKRGKIIQISGGGAASPFPMFCPYSVSKAGVVRFIENISIEARKYNIYANSIAPGPINTRMLDEVLKAGPKKVGVEFYNKSLLQHKSGGTNILKIISLIHYLADETGNGISGKLISVLWDKWENFEKFKNKLSNSDVGTLRRIAGRDRKLNFFDK